MKRVAFARQGIRLCYPQMKLGRLVVPLALAVWTVAVDGPAAETSGWQQVIGNPATTLRMLSPKEGTEPISEEIWVGPDSSPKSPSLSATPEKIDLAPDILRIRVPKSNSHGWALAEDTGNEAHPPSQPEAKPRLSHSAKDVLKSQVPGLRPNGKAPPSDGSNELQAVYKPEVKPEPHAWIKLAAKRLPDNSVRIQRCEAPKRKPEELKGAGLFHIPKISDSTALVSKPEVTTEIGESDEALFHTTSTPVKPAGLVFRPKSDDEPDTIDHALEAKPSSEASLRVPSRPTDQPDVPTSWITRHLGARDQASHTTWWPVRRVSGTSSCE